ncbi:MAG: methyltransferase domain-containing protein [Syntrophobacteraceae bacterium]
MEPMEIKAHVARYYAALYAEHARGVRPCASLPIKTGKDLALELGYPVATLSAFLHESYWNSFLPCGNLLRCIDIAPGSRALNLGCGAAVDSFALAALHGPDIEIVGMDVVADIVGMAKKEGTRLGGARLLWACGDGEHLPFRGGSFDWVLMNGVLNLFPDKTAALRETRRVLKPSGRLACADLFAAEALPGYFAEEPDAWAWCMSGASTKRDVAAMMDAAGFGALRWTEEEEGDLFTRAVFSCRRES